MPVEWGSYDTRKRYHKEWENYYYSKGCSYLKVLRILTKKDMLKPPPDNKMSS